MHDFHLNLAWTKIQTALTGLGAWLGLFLGGMDGLLYALVIFAVVDYITGVMVAAANKKLSSAIGFKGICRKVLLFCLVGIAHTLDTHVVGSGSALRTATLFYEISNEGISLLENASCLGLPIPEKLKDALAQLHNREKKDLQGDSKESEDDD